LRASSVAVVSSQVSMLPRRTTATSTGAAGAAGFGSFFPER